ncbi:MAG: phosphodiester glycosidase family protein [Verrucomicrobia bacterium]|nr:phosphodiester glycosidase family protein [Verrucomicrobiota bacterium]
MHSRPQTIRARFGARSRGEEAPLRILAAGWKALRFVCVSGWIAHAALTARSADLPASATNAPPDITYQNYRSPRGPWSIHVVRVPRGKAPFQVSAMHAGGRAIGLARLSDHTGLLRSDQLTPMAAINGDFYQRGGPYAGDPRGLQIVEGELISAPSGSVSFWIDALGEPHAANTESLLQVTWPDGTTVPIGLNGNRSANEIELYTPALGASTQTGGGRELVLEPRGNAPSLPLRPGRIYPARIREIRETGNTRIHPGTMVLSIGPALARRTPRVQSGDELIVSTATSPSLRGARTAISGGPLLVQDGKRQRIQPADSDSYEVTSMTERHPRSAIGWSENYFFLVQVDGRQRNLSVGMTLNELAAFLVEIGCQGAINLDGGGSATLWYDGRVRNRPCDGYERAVANSVVVFKKNRATLDPEKTGAALSGRSR